MTFRKLVCALVAGLGLAIVPLAPASAASYPPGPTPPGSVRSTTVVVLAGDPVNFLACGFLNAGLVDLAVDGGPVRAVEPGGDGCLRESYVFDRVGEDVITAFVPGVRTVTLHVIVRGAPALSSAGGGSGLPFTGLDVELVATAGAAAAGGGIFLLLGGRRRRTGRGAS